MPMYDYECKACGHTFETIARVDETPPCPSCGKSETERLMGAPMITGKAGISYSLPKDHPKSGPKR